MLLVITNSQDATADYLIAVLKAHSIPLIRFDTDIVLENAKVRGGDDGPQLQIDGCWLRPTDVTTVWYRRPLPLRGSSTDQTPEERYVLEEWAEVFEGYFAHIPRQNWMNHPSSNASASHKLEQLSRARTLGLNVPETIITQEEHQLRDFYMRHIGQIVVKPMAQAYIERKTPDLDSLIYTNKVSANDLDDLSQLSKCPTLFQRLIDKQYDVRITIVDSELYAVRLSALDIDGMQRCDIRRNNMEDVQYSKIDLPEDVVHKLKQLMRSYSLRFAAIDMVVDKLEKWYFLEVNPNGQWAWLDLQAGTDIASGFLKSFQSPKSLE